MTSSSVSITAERTPSVAQFRAARALLDWSQDRLAAEAEVGRATVGDFERGARSPIRLSLKAMKRALEAAGIEFLWTQDGGEGVMLRPPPASGTSAP
jgi:transcriptional regulator with XRE-family HTH domain